MGQIVDIGAVVRTLSQTGNPEKTGLPEITAEELLFVLDETFNGDEEACFEALLQTIDKAQKEGRPSLLAIANWVDQEIDNLKPETICDQFL